MTTPEDFTGRVALVTGAASGIGAAVATRLAADGAHVAVADNNGLGAERTVRMIREAGGHATAVAVDVTDPASVDAAVTATVAAFGALHLAVNSAGVAGPAVPTGEYDPQDWRRVIDVDLSGVFVGLTKSAALEYASQGIRVNAVAPGFVETPLLAGALTPLGRRTLVRAHPLGRFGDAGEVAELVAFLLSDHASFITGSYHLVDGGYAATETQTSPSTS